MSAEEYHDVGTTGPSRNFVYDMERYRYFVRDEWDEVLAHDERGEVVRGSFDALEAAQVAGREIRVGIAGLASGLAAGPAGTGDPLRHEVFSNVGSGFLHTGPRLYAALTHPLVRVAPAVPLRYASGQLGRGLGLPAHGWVRPCPPARSVHAPVGRPRRALRLPLVRPLGDDESAYRQRRTAGTAGDPPSAGWRDPGDARSPMPRRPWWRCTRPIRSASFCRLGRA